MREFSYIPDTSSETQRLSIANLWRHDYWGEDFLKGDCTFGVFVSDKGTYYGVCTFGDWNEFSLEWGDYVEFKHTQTFRKTYLRYCGVISKGFDNFKDFTEGKIRMWTLK